MDILLATTNLHKLREFKELFKPFKKIELISLLQFPGYEAPEETGKTLIENALIKAEDAARVLKIMTLADDSGLSVPALGGMPGVYSRRYAGENATDADNRKKLLQEMAKFDEEMRQAYFECVLALATPEGEKKTFVGKCEGVLIKEERGRNGFGYDPLFVKYDYDKTFAELDEQTKNRISHRRRAFDKMIPTLEALG